ncbi:flagellar protein FlgJ [Duganella sp. CF517]|uniref:glycoside hydrolase family 73 protein n=1 Tax=Duganella sp. CF517 TaxID=1881038 RepID=UPI0008CB79CD|nr:glucosaminidase domain-containing protein [Duganella sp. CF517]SEN14057.1 flagellar protein FlgJ [Duganella sp. CF517]
MRQLNFMPATAPTAATVSNMTASRPVAAVGAFSSSSSSSSSGNFASTFRQVQQDVATFISHGGGGFGDPAPSPSASQALSLQAMALQRSSGAIDGEYTGVNAGTGAGGIDSDLQKQFLASIKPWAEETGNRLGVSPDVVAAHAALESGWGLQPLRKGGADTNNLFGIKAGGNWKGAVAAATTTEYEQGAMLKKTERFRSYPDAASAFRDYADMLSSNPRYQAALNTGNDARAFATGLARGGYATDPAYADKLSKLAAQVQRGAGATIDSKP